MSMKRTIPGGRVESIYTQANNGKEVIATKIEHVEAEVPEEEILEGEEPEEAKEEAKENE